MSRTAGHILLPEQCLHLASTSSLVGSLLVRCHDVCYVCNIRLRLHSRTAQEVEDAAEENATDESRAQDWIRREKRVLDFLTLLLVTLTPGVLMVSSLYLQECRR